MYTVAPLENIVGLQFGVFIFSFIFLALFGGILYVLIYLAVIDDDESDASKAKFFHHIKILVVSIFVLAFAFTIKDAYTRKHNPNTETYATRIDTSMLIDREKCGKHSYCGVGYVQYKLDGTDTIINFKIDQETAYPKRIVLYKN